MEYAENINEYSPHRETIYNLITNYFDNPKMVKLYDTEPQRGPDGNRGNSGGSEGKSVYGCKIYSLLSVDNRYIIAIVKKDTLPINFNVHLKDLNWECFQTRSIRDYPYKFKSSHKYSIKKSAEYMIPFYVRSRTQDASEYISQEANILITLLNSGKSIYTFGNEGTLVSALETFNTVITFLGI
jgi:hypothetical protein